MSGPVFISPDHKEMVVSCSYSSGYDFRSLVLIRVRLYDMKLIWSSTPLYLFNTILTIDAQRVALTSDWSIAVVAAANNGPFAESDVTMLFAVNLTNGAMLWNYTGLTHKFVSRFSSVAISSNGVAFVLGEFFNTVGTALLEAYNITSGRSITLVDPKQNLGLGPSLILCDNSQLIAVTTWEGDAVYFFDTNSFKVRQVVKPTDRKCATCVGSGLGFACACDMTGSPQTVAISTISLNDWSIKTVSKVPQARSFGDPMSVLTDGSVLFTIGGSSVYASQLVKVGKK
jgi:outer membrane protein assembly factor BamB